MFIIIFKQCHPLMNEAVPSLFGSPVLIQTGTGECLFIIFKQCHPLMNKAVPSLFGSPVLIPVPTSTGMGNGFIILT
jgi:hypothetical protein